MQVEHVARIGLAPRRAAQQQRHLAIGDGLLGQIVIDDDGMGTVVAEELAHGAARVGRQELSGAGSDAVAATTIEYSSAPWSSRIFTNLATLERFWPMAT